MLPQLVDNLTGDDDAAGRFDREPEAFSTVLGDELATWVAALRRDSLRIRSDLSPPGTGPVEPPVAQQAPQRQVVVNNPALTATTAELWQSLLGWALTSEANFEELRRNPEEAIRRINPEAPDAAVQVLVDRLRPVPEN